MAERRSVWSEALHGMAWRLLQPLSAFVLLMLIGRHSDSLLGEYALVTTVYFVMQTLPLLGLSPFVMREAAREPSRCASLLVGVGALALASAALLGLGWVLMRPLVDYPPSVLQALDVVAVGISWGIVAYLCEALLMSQQRTRVVAKVALWESAARLAASMAILLHAPSITDLFLVFFAGRLAALAVYLRVLWRMGLQPVSAGELRALARELRPVLPAFLAATVLALAASRMDYLVLSVHADLSVLGHYAVSYRYLEVAGLGIAAVVTALYPRLARLHVAQPQRFAAVAGALIDAALLLLPALAIAAVLASELYGRWLFPRQYPAAAALTMAYGALIALAGFDALLAGLLLSADRQRADARALSVGTGVLALALLGLVPGWLGWGAFWAGALALLTQSTLRLRTLRAMGVPMPGRAAVLRVLLALACGGLAAWAAADRSAAGHLLALACAPLAYLMLALVLGTVPLGRWLRTLAREIPAGEAADPAADGHWAFTLRLIAADLRARDERLGPQPMRNHGATAVVLYRLSRCLTLRGHRFTGRLIWQLNLLLTKAELPPGMRAGPGFVLTHSVGIIAVGQAGAHVTMRAWSAFGVRGRSDVGAGPGMPVVGDQVLFEPRSALHGGLHCPPGLVVPAHRVVVTARRLQAMATPDAARAAGAA